MLKQLQEEVKSWSRYNFGSQPSWRQLLGAVEEIGELAHAHLKREQGIRSHENHTAAAKDAVADIIIYLADYCATEGFDMEAIVQETWDRVKQRNWRKNPSCAHKET